MIQEKLFKAGDKVKLSGTFLGVGYTAMVMWGQPCIDNGIELNKYSIRKNGGHYTFVEKDLELISRKQKNHEQS